MTIQNLIRPTIKALKPYSSARDEFQGVSADMVFLDANENPFENGVNRYPDPHQNKLKTLLSQIKNVPTQNMLLGNGSDEVLDLIFRMFCEPHVDNVIILPPTYGMYEVLANLNAVETIKVPLSTNFQLEIDSILNVSNSKSKILFWLIGGLNYQVEHHVLPDVCHVHYKNLTNIVADTAKEFGMPYHVKKNLFQAIGDHIKMLRSLGVKPEVNIA